MRGWKGVVLFGGFILLAIRLVGDAARPVLAPVQLRILEGVARNRSSGNWTELSSNQLVELKKKAEGADESIRKSHLPGGLVASLRYADTNNTAEVVAYEDLDLSGAYTGLYLSACCFRYAVYRDPAVLSSIRAALDGVDLLLRSSGRPGYLPRFAGLSTDAAYKKYYSHWGGEDPNRPGFGRLAHPGGPDAKSYVWLGSPSREVYSGVNLGLASIFQYVREPKIRERMSNIIDQMVGRLEADHWRLDDGQGNLVFVPPLQAAAILRTAASISPKKYNTLYQARLTAVMNAHGGEPLAQAGICLYCNYEESVFQLADLMVLCRLESETSPGKLFFQERMTQIYRRSNFHLNPWLAAAYVSTLERAPGDVACKAALQGMLYQFPMPRWTLAAVRGTNAVSDLLEANGEKWARVPFQLEERQVQAFQWAQSPVYLPPGRDEPVVHPGIDFILPFWIARDGNVIPDAESITSTANLKAPSTNSFRSRLPGTNTVLNRHSPTNASPVHPAATNSPLFK